MYGMFGGCTTLFHLAIRHPVLVLALGLSGFVSQIPANPGPGDRLGTDSMLVQIENKIVRDHPELASNVGVLRNNFDKLEATPTEAQVREVLAMTDFCTEESAREVLANETDRREAAWILYLNTYSSSRDGPRRAEQLFLKRNP